MTCAVLILPDVDVLTRFLAYAKNLVRTIKATKVKVAEEEKASKAKMQQVCAELLEDMQRERLQRRGGR
jgi:hypothetical protein